MLTDIYRKASGLLQCSIARHHRITFSSGNSPAGGLKLVTSVVAALQNVTGKSTQRGSGLMNHVNVFVQTGWFVFCISVGGEKGKKDLQQHTGAKNANVSHQKTPQKACQQMPLNPTHWTFNSCTDTQLRFLFIFLVSWWKPTQSEQESEYWPLRPSGGRVSASSQSN